jgi:ABC-type transport system substrate-binding protein
MIMFKRVMSIVVVMLIVVALCAACSKQAAPTTSPSDSSQSPQTKTSAAMKLTVVAPEGWIPNTTNPSMIMKGTNTYTISTDRMPSEAQTPDAYVEFAKTNFNKNFSNCKFGASSNLTVSGCEARRLEFTGEVMRINMSYIIVYVFKDGIAYTLTCGAGDDISKVKADYEKIIASAKLE